MEADNKPKIHIIEAECIHSTISAIPYRTEDNIVNALEWIFLKPKNEWYKIFLDFIENTVKMYDSINQNTNSNDSRNKSAKTNNKRKKNK